MLGTACIITVRIEPCPTYLGEHILAVDHADLFSILLCIRRYPVVEHLSLMEAPHIIDVLSVDVHPVMTGMYLGLRLLRDTVTTLNAA